MNLSQYRTRVSGAMGVGGIASSTEEGLIDAWVNEGIVDFLRKTKITKKKASLDLTAGTSDYEIDADILALADVWIEPASGAQSLLLDPVDSRDIRDLRNAGGVAAPPTYLYALEGWNLLMLYPTPTSSSDNLHILYVPRPTAMSATADAPSSSAFGQIPAEFHQVIEYYAMWRAGMHTRDQSSQGGQLYKQLYDEGVAESKMAMTRRGGLQFREATIGRRRRPWYSPGIDDGS